MDKVNDLLSCNYNDTSFSDNSTTDSSPFYLRIMHISAANISQIVTDRTNIASANNYKVAYCLSIGILTFDLGLF